MTEKLQGTFSIDGLIEGTSAGLDEIESRLREWVRFAASVHLHFNLEIDGNAFSLLADARAAPVAELSAPHHEIIRQALSDLLELLDQADRPAVFSTLRSVEYREGAEVQTLYVLGSDAQVHVRQRTVDAETAAPPPPVTTRRKIIYAAAGVGVAGLILLLTSLFVDYGRVFGWARQRFLAYDTDKLTVEADAFAGYFTVEGKAADRRGQGEFVVLTLKRGPAFPRTPADVERLLSTTRPSGPARLAAEAVARGYVRCEQFDKERKFLRFTSVRVAGLREEETVEVALPISPEHRLARVVITY
jgi:hypothetical protein